MVRVTESWINRVRSFGGIGPSSSWPGFGLLQEIDEWMCNGCFVG